MAFALAWTALAASPARADEIAAASCSEAHVAEAISQAAGRPQSLREALDGLVNGHMDFFLGHPDEYVLLFQGRMLLKLDRGLVCDIDRPFENYLNRIEELVRPYLPVPVDNVKIRRLVVK